METDIKITIPFYDTDPMRVVWHGNYVKYFEQARCAYLKERDLTYNDMEKAGYLFPVVELKVKYIRPCVFGQVIKVTAAPVQCDNCLIFKYRITDAESGQILCKGETRQMCVLKDTLESRFILPEEFTKKLFK